MEDEFAAKILRAHKRSYRRAFETAVRTGTALVVMRGDKLVEVKPPYKYQLVPLKSVKKKKLRKK